jgi:hypothetical protein
VNDENDFVMSHQAGSFWMYLPSCENGEART